MKEPYVPQRHPACNVEEHNWSARIAHRINQILIVRAFGHSLGAVLHGEQVSGTQAGDDSSLALTDPLMLPMALGAGYESKQGRWLQPASTSSHSRVKCASTSSHTFRPTAPLLLLLFDQMHTTSWWRNQ